jgi:hypothetical protein
VNRRTLGLFCISVLSVAQISMPRIGFVRDRQGSLRPLMGVTGAFVLGEPVLTRVVAASSSGGEYALASTGDEVILIKATEVVWRRSVVGAESFGFRPDGRPEWVRFANGSCLIWPAEGEPEMASVCDKRPPEPVRYRARLPDDLTGESELVAPGWVLLRATDRLYLSRLGTEEAIFEMPEAPE